MTDKKRWCDLRWHKQKQNSWTEESVCHSLRLSRPHLELVPTSKHHWRAQPSMWPGWREGPGTLLQGESAGRVANREGSRSRCHISKKLLGQRAQMWAARPLCSHLWRFAAVSLGRISSHLRSPDPGLHPWPTPMAPHLSGVEDRSGNRVRVWPEVHTAGTKRHQRPYKVANSSCRGV